MGIPVAVADLLFHEHAYKPIVGDVGFIGRQTTYLTEFSLGLLAGRHGMVVPSDLEIEVDKQTLATQNHPTPFITDRTLVRFFGGNYLSIDVSDYEGADVVADMSKPVPKKYHKRFDFLFDGSCLDNIFNPAQALINMSRMLKLGGRMVLINHGTQANGSYTVFSPGWFFDFFAANRYADCKVYLQSFDDHQQLSIGGLPTHYYNWKKHPLGATPGNASNVLLYVIAEKAKDSTDDVQPVQFQYRDSESNAKHFVPNVERIYQSTRPVPRIGLEFDQPASYPYCGIMGDDMRF